MKENSDITVLVVDDEPQLRNAIIDSLEIEDFKVFSAENGKMALDLLEKEDVDFVLSDIQMPQMDGVSLSKEIRRKYKDIPVIMLISGFSDYTREEIIESGAIDFIEKPFNIEHIIETIVRVVNK